MFRTAAGVLCVLLGVTAAQGKIVSKVIETQIDGVKHVGTLVFDDEISGKRPGVLVCHEWWGCNEYAKKRATMLAEKGYVAFALDMYGEGKATRNPKQAGEWMGGLMKDPAKMREIAASGLKVLAEDEHTDASQLSAIGYCMGGTVALELARSGLKYTENLKAITAFHASNVAAKNSEDNKNIKGSVLICHGAIDGFVKPGELENFHKQMEEAKIDYQVVSYAGALHAFTNPEADSYKLDGVKYNEKADKRSWKALLGLLKEIFSKQSQHSEK